VIALGVVFWPQGNSCKQNKKLWKETMIFDFQTIDSKKVGRICYKNKNGTTKSMKSTLVFSRGRKCYMQGRAGSRSRLKKKSTNPYNLRGSRIRFKKP